MSFIFKTKNRIHAILFAILPAFAVGSLVIGANVYYDLDTSKVIVNEVQRIVKSGSVALEILGITRLGDGGTANYAQFSETGDLAFTGTADTITGPGAGGMTVTNAGGALTFSTTSSGTLSFTSAGALNLSAGAASTWTLANVADALNFDSNTLSIDALNNSVGIGTSSLSGVKFKIALGSRSVSDTYDDQSKIASLSNATLLSSKIQISEAVCGSYTIQDADGNSYNTVLIGAQCWLKQNLRTGTKILGSASAANNGIVEKYCYNDTDANCTTDGGLYQWNEAMGYITTAGAQGICPSGWHIPTDAQQYALENYLKDGANSCVSTRSGWGCETAGTKLKVGGASGFEGILAGYRDTGGSFSNRLSDAYFWSSSQYDASSAWRRALVSGNSAVNRGSNDKAYGFSVRCLKD